MTLPILIRGRRTIAALLRRLSDRLAPDGSNDIDTLRTRYPDAPAHWLELLRGRSAAVIGGRAVRAMPAKVHRPREAASAPVARGPAATIHAVRYPPHATPRPRAVVRFAELQGDAVATAREMRDLAYRNDPRQDDASVDIRSADQRRDPSADDRASVAMSQRPETVVTVPPRKASRTVAFVPTRPATRFHAAFATTAQPGTYGPQRALATDERSTDASERRTFRTRFESVKRDTVAATTRPLDRVADDAEHLPPMPLLIESAHRDASGPHSVRRQERDTEDRNADMRWPGIDTPAAPDARRASPASNAVASTDRAAKLQPFHSAFVHAAHPPATTSESIAAAWPELPHPPSLAVSDGAMRSARMNQLIADQEGRGWSGSPS